MTEIRFEAKKTRLQYSSSILFVLIVLISTIILYSYNSSLEGKISSIKTKIDSINVNIADVEQDESLRVFYLLDLNRKNIDHYDNMNKITKYINHMNFIREKYFLEISGFNLSNGNITANANVFSNDDGIAYYKVKDFIKNYRNDKDALFDLGFVSSVEGMDNIKFRLNFKIK